MREPVVHSKESRDIAWQNQASLGSFPMELAIQSMSDDRASSFQSSEETSSGHQTSKTQSSGFWSSAVEVVTRVWKVADDTLAGIFGLDQSKYSLYEHDLDTSDQVMQSSRQSSTTSWMTCALTKEDAEKDEVDIEAPPPHR